MTDLEDKLAEALRDLLMHVAYREPYARTQFQIARAVLAAYDAERAKPAAVTDEMCETALDAFYGEDDWRKDYDGEHWKPISCMRAALESIAPMLASAQVGVPDGWQLVPKIATEDMILAAAPKPEGI